MTILGTQVIYYSLAAPSIPRVAIVTETSTENPDLPVDTVALCVLNPSDVTVITRAERSDVPAPGCWVMP
jgi:hypothetical protein